MNWTLSSMNFKHKCHSHKTSVVPKGGEEIKNGEVFTEYGVLVNSGPYTGKTSEEAQKLMAEYLEEHNLGQKIYNVQT